MYSLSLNDDEKLINSVNIEFDGYFLGKSENWRDKSSGAEKIITHANLNVQNINLHSFNFMYRFPKLALPREKLAIVSEKYEIKNIRNKDNADLLVVSDTYVNYMLDQIWKEYTTVDKLKSVVFDNENLFLKSTYQEIIDIFNELPPDGMINTKDRYYYGGQGKKLEVFYKKLNDIVDNERRGYCVYVKPDQIDNWTFLLNNLDKTIIDTYLSDIATEDSIILTEEEYNNIYKMFKSEDRENHALAMEMMANCNVSESKPFLALLFFNFTQKFKDCKSWNHVNFKTLRTNFEKYTLDYNRYNAHPYDSMIKTLIEDKCLTLFTLNEMIKLMFKNVLQDTFGLNSETVFKIDKEMIQLKDKFAQHLKNDDLTEIIVENGNNNYYFNHELPF